MKKISIAIDGPAASGKSTTARLVAQSLNYLHIDTGAMYRAITLKVLDGRMDINDRQTIEEVAHSTAIRLIGENGGNKVLLDGVDVTRRIRKPNVTQAVSTISSYRGVREVMVREQQRMALQGGVVLEGRDIGTVVLPNAELKIFMSASVEERARRRKKDLAQDGIEADEKELARQIEARDRSDSMRETSPLRRAEDAIDLDTSDMTVEAQVDFIVRRAEKIIHEAEPV